MASRSKGSLRPGYTTGACAAAAAKAAAFRLAGKDEAASGRVEIPFPDGTRRELKVRRVWASHDGFSASVVKDAGDDPDVTHGIEIVASVALARDDGSLEPAPQDGRMPRVVIKGGQGVGVVTRPGLSVAVGSFAINPVPLRMIREAVYEALKGAGAVFPEGHAIEVTLSVPEGEKVAQKTLNSRLGIKGGISILGTTGIVRPLSSEAWTATITASVDVARAMGLKEVVLSSGRASEKAHMSRYNLPEEAYVMMGDYVQYALKESAAGAFRRIHLCAQWAKMLKVAMAVPETHVRHGAIDPRKAASFLEGLGCLCLKGRPFNTAREMLDTIQSRQVRASRQILSTVCSAAKSYAESLTNGVPVQVLLVSYEGEIIAQNG